MRTAYLILLLHPTSGEYVSTYNQLGVYPSMTAAIIAAATYYPGITNRIQPVKLTYHIAGGRSYAAHS